MHAKVQSRFALVAVAVAVILYAATVKAAKLNCPKTQVEDSKEGGTKKALADKFLGHPFRNDPFKLLDNRVADLSESIGIPCDVLRYFLGALFCYVLAIGHSLFLPENNVKVKQFVQSVVGIVFKLRMFRYKYAASTAIFPSVRRLQNNG